MPASASLPHRIAVVLGYLEALALFGYGLSIVLFERSGSTSGISGSGADLAPAVLVALYAAFAALVALVTWMVMRGRRAAHTPFLMVQAFALVIAQPLLASSSARLAGVLLVLTALAAGGSALAPTVRRSLT